jgi:hypothetical protein
MAPPLLAGCLEHEPKLRGLEIGRTGDIASPKQGDLRHDSQACSESP